MIDKFVLDLILKERKRQDEKWGEQNHDDYKWLAILTEEIGELSQAILHTEFGGYANGNAPIELIQAVAVGIQWLECMQRRSGAELFMVSLDDFREIE
jgi:NTP pyrophosphatase (non-canonical NTP hydrolase)